MWPHPDWIKFLSLPRHQVAMAATCLVLATLARKGFLQASEPWVGAAIGMGVLLLVLGCTGWATQCFRAIRAERRAAAHLAALSTDEKVLLARALKENTRCITAFSFHPAVLSLKAKGLIYAKLVIGEDAPHIIPDYVWKQLERHRDDFVKYSDWPLSNERTRI